MVYFPYFLGAAETYASMASLGLERVCHVPYYLY